MVSMIKKINEYINLSIILSVLFMIVGILLIVWPKASLDTFAYVIGTIMIIYGIYSFIRDKRFTMFGSFYQKNKKLTLFDHKNKSSNTFGTIKDDVYFKGLTIPISQFIYHANKDGSIVVPLEAYSVVEWRNTYTPSEPFGSIINTTKEDDNPLLLIFDFKQ